MRIEFYLDKTGCFTKVINFKLDDQVWQSFDKLSPEQIESIFRHMLTFKKSRIALHHLSAFFPGNKKEILRQFIHCNWTKLNNYMDITDKQLNYERIDCPFKSTGNCPFNTDECKAAGIVCIKI